MGRRGVSLATACLAAAVLLAGCSSGGGSKASTSSSTSTATSTTTTPPSSSATTRATTSTTRPPDLAIGAFQTPTGNIGCVVASGIARCDIKQHTWTPPPKPASCNLDYGNGLTLDVQGPARVSCAGDTVLDPSARVLPYGQRTRQGSIVCDSEQAGVTCTNETNTHGFFLSSGSYRLF